MTTASSPLDTSASHLALIDEAAASVKARVGAVPPVLVVAGSGLGAFADRVEGAQSVGYGDLKHFPQSAVAGHAGKLVWGKVKGRPVIVMSGRKHVYEGVDVRLTVLPLRALVRAGVKTVILSNAAGGLSRQLAPGDLMLIDDHIALQHRNPLIGANIGEMGPRFPDMSAPYDRALMEIARRTAAELGIRLGEGVYLALTGPTYETQAEVQAYRTMADAVGMSTAAETIAAVHAGARVLGISAITNSHVQRTGVVTTHEEVMEIGKQVTGDFCRLVEGIIERL